MGKPGNNKIKNCLDALRPAFSEGGRLHCFKSVFDGMESFLYVSSEQTKTGSNIRDAIELKRIMSIVVIALMPAMLFGMYNVGWQNYHAAGLLEGATFLQIFFYGFLAVLPKILVSYIVGLGIEFAWAQMKGEEIQEGYLVSGILIPLIVPVNCPLWVLALAVAFAVIFVKEIFGGTGMNIFNVALSARAFLFFSYPTVMSGDSVWIANQTIFGLGGTLPDSFTQATPLAMVAQNAQVPYSISDMVLGFIPGSIGETSVVAIAIGALILLYTRVASWKIMLSVFVGGAVTAALFSAAGNTPIPWYEHLILGGFCFGAVFMATDPVTAARTETGKYIYGLLIGVMAVVIRVLNPGYPEGMMLAILLMNMFAPLIDYCVVERNIARRAKRAALNQK